MVREANRAPKRGGVSPKFLKRPTPGAVTQCSSGCQTQTVSRFRRVGLVGCVKQKSASPRQARDLYVSALFIGRRECVERTCSEWWILSALHGLTSPDEVVEPYDVTLQDAGRAGRREWSEKVLESLDERVGLRPGEVVEIHAGSDYRDFGLAQGLRARGVTVVVPTQGLPLGQQLAFFRDEADR